MIMQQVKIINWVEHSEMFEVDNLTLNAAYVNVNPLR